MNDLTLVRKKISDLQCCVLIPTYNNDRTLDDVIRRTLLYTSDIIVVNDGSTDSTPQILSAFHNIVVLNGQHNRGKGSALQKGFSYAISRGFRYAITIDSDGQHFPEDIPAFIDCISQNPDSLIMGIRDMSQKGVPGTSSFGHRFSIFWFKVETGLTVDDVQTGYRLYPLNEIQRFRHFYSRKYEFEVEIMVRLAWRGVKVTEVPVKIYYAPDNERVSHFRKVRDFTRVSIMNTLLVFLALLWFRPLSFFNNLRKKTIREVINEYVINSEDSNTKLSLSMALGMFTGVLPIWGWQMVTAFGLAHALKLNKFVTVVASNISIPPVLPLILYLSYITGGWVLGITNRVQYSNEFGLAWIKENLIQYIIGSLVFGLILALGVGAVTYIFLRIFRNRAIMAK
jgi:glycosyltransferase involved in cell wall biosynthesis